MSVIPRWPTDGSPYTSPTPTMLDSRTGDGSARFTLHAPAKVNLFLELVARRPDGYHDLRTLMVAVSLADELAFAPAPHGEFRLSCSDPRLDAGPGNLVAKAAALLQRTTGCDAGAAVRLTKAIPLEAGLAGGSSDAAAALIGLNRLWGLGLGADKLRPLAAELGSDVAFFLRPPAAWCTGRGEVVEPLKLGRRLHLVLVCPQFGLSTAAVYRESVVPAEPLSGDEIRRAVVAGDVDAIGRYLHNRLQEPAAQLRPELVEWLERLAALNPAGRLMSGSGSTVFALARDYRDAVRIAAGVRAGSKGLEGVQLHVVRTCV